MSAVEVSVTGSGDLTRLQSEAIALLGGRAYTRPGATQARFRRLRESILRRLRRSPPPRSGGTFVWSHDPEANARARRWFFAHYPKGYTRTGKLPEAWDILISIARDGLTVTIVNQARAASYVYGDEDQAQIPGHAETGWFESADEVLEAGVMVERYLNDETDLILQEALR
jgi:hypothetical protein